MEQRYSRRLRIFATIEVKSTESPSFTGMIYNFCLEGAFILHSMPPTVGKLVNIRLIATPENDLSLPVSGMVIHRNEHGFGLMFCQEESGGLYRLDKFKNNCLSTAYY